MSIYDYIVIGFYLVFMLFMGKVFKNFSKTASDFFRCGGGGLWWIVGSSTFMSAFSAWSFTGGAAKAYETGTFFLLLFLCNFAALWFTYFITAARFRQMRIITAIDAVRKRFGTVNEQFFTWLLLPSKVLFGGLMLYTISVFMSGVFGTNIPMLILVLGVTVMVMTLAGGAWAAIASDYVQMLLVLTITIVMAVLSIYHPAVGGFSGLIDKLPSYHFDWTIFDRPWVILYFAITLLINQLVQNNSMLLGAAKYVFAKDGPDAKKATLLSIFGFLILTPIWLIPAVAATIVHPNLAAEYPKLNNPNEAAYVAMAITLLPKGLLGLLVCAIFSASVGSMTAVINTSAGTFVRNFYIQVMNKKASENKQILVGRIFILLFVLSWMLVAMIFVNSKELKLFDILLIMAASIQIPMTVPLFFGIFIKKTPAWAGWTTMVIGFIFSILLRFVLTIPKLFDNLLSPESPFNKQELADLNIATTTAVLFFVCTTWFFITMLFYKKTYPQYDKQVNEFFVEMTTPVDTLAEHGSSYESDSRQYRVLGNLCLAYGGFMLLLLFIPNPPTAIYSILFCGLTMGIMGLVLVLKGRRLIKINQKGLNEPTIH
jgi:SSS family solute:Na+ symporter